MAARAYLRLDPHVYDRKVLGVDNDGEPIEGWSPYPPDALVAFFGTLALADMQPERGHFRSERVLRELLRGAEGLGQRYARQVPLLIERGDLVLKSSGRLYVAGWDVWQEGDLTVPERMRRYRANQAAKRNGVTPAVTAGVTETVTPHPSDGGRHGSSTYGGTSSRGGGTGRGISRGGAPSRAPSRSMTDQERTALVAANRQLLESTETSDDARRAAIRTLHRLDPDTDWAAMTPKAHANGTSDSPSRPRRAANA